MERIKIHFVISPTEYAQKLGKACIERWGNAHIYNATHIVSLGGDGTALFARQEALGAYFTTGHILPIYDVDCCDFKQNPFHVGALMNAPLKSVDELVARIEQAEPTEEYPLRADYQLSAEYNGVIQQSIFGFNEVYLKADISKEVRLHVDIQSKDGNENRQFNLSGDGIIVATPSGQGAYYQKAGGMPFATGQLGVQGICTGLGNNYVISDKAVVNVEVLSKHSPTYVLHDNAKPSKQVKSASICRAKIPLTILRDIVKQRN